MYVGELSQITFAFFGIFWPHIYPCFHFYCSKNSIFLTTYPPLNANVICEGSLWVFWLFLNPPPPYVRTFSVRERPLMTSDDFKLYLFYLCPILKRVPIFNDVRFCPAYFFHVLFVMIFFSFNIVQEGSKAFSFITPSEWFPEYITQHRPTILWENIANSSLREKARIFCLFWERIYTFRNWRHTQYYTCLMVILIGQCRNIQSFYSQKVLGASRDLAYITLWFEFQTSYNY